MRHKLSSHIPQVIVEYPDEGDIAISLELEPNWCIFRSVHLQIRIASLGGAIFRNRHGKRSVIYKNITLEGTSWAMFILLENWIIYMKKFDCIRYWRLLRIVESHFSNVEYRDLLDWNIKLTKAVIFDRYTITGKYVLGRSTIII